MDGIGFLLSQILVLLVRLLVLGLHSYTSKQSCLTLPHWCSLVGMELYLYPASLYVC